MIVCRLSYFEMLLLTVPEKADAALIGRWAVCPLANTNRLCSCSSLRVIEGGRFVKSCGFPERLLCALLEAASRVSSTKHKLVAKVFMVQILDVSTTTRVACIGTKTGNV